MLKHILAAFLASTAFVSFAQTQPAAPQSPAAEQLKVVLDEDLKQVFKRGPFQATIRGIPGYDDKLPDMSFAELQRQRAYERATLAKLKTIDPKALKGQDHVSYELILDKMEMAVEGQKFNDAEGLVLSTLGGAHNTMPRLAQVTPFKSEQNYRDYIKRVSAVPKYVDGTIERLRAGMKSGWMSPKPVVERVVAAMDAHLVDNVDDSVLLAPFKRAHAELIPDAKRAIAEDYQPALRRYRAFLVDEYLPKSPPVGGLAALPGGEGYYEFLIRQRIVRGMSAKQIHELGLREVDRIREEISGIAKQVGFKGSTDEFIEYMRTDRKFFFKSSEEVLAAYREMSSKVDPQLPRLFWKVPRMPYAVRAMTPAEAASSTAANYMPGSLKLGTSAYFTINALGYDSEAKWEIETLFVHEAVPGHHMQIARASEMENLHQWRTMGTFNTAYGEGWALYAEKLGFGLGLYKDPYQHYGHLQAELFRGARLVVDTGIHAYNWPRDKAIAYMRKEGGTDDNFAVSEVDRYFSNPAQALGYKIGQLKFLELRARAEKALGPKFDVRDFHAVAIDNGSVPLIVLEKLVDEYIAGRPV